MKKLLTLLTTTIFLFSHPHTFIDLYPTISGNTFTLKWVFDEMTSNMIMMDFDEDHDMKLNDKEQKLIHDEAFIHLKEFNFYAHMMVGDKEQSIKKVSNFKTYFENNRVVYQFDIELPKKLNAIEFYDPDLYIAFVLKQESIKSDKKFQLEEINNDYYFGYKVAL